MKKPKILAFGFSPELIERVVKEYERDNPDKDGWEMPPKEFASRAIAVMAENAEIIEGGNT